MVAWTRTQELTFEELCFMMHRLFRDRLSSKVENLMLKYTDAGRVVRYEGRRSRHSVC